MPYITSRLVTWWCHDKNTFCITGPLCRDFQAQRATNAEHWRYIFVTWITFWTKGKVAVVTRRLNRGRASDAYCVCKLTKIGSDNGLSPDGRHAIIWTNVGILLSWALGTNVSAISIAIHLSSFKNMDLIMSSAKLWPFCLGPNKLTCRSHRLNVLLWSW